MLFNQQATALTHFDAEEALGQPVERLFSSPDDEALLLAIHRTASLPVGASLPLKATPISTRTGGLRRVDGHVRRRQCCHNEPCIFVIARDVTRALAEEARQRRSEKLAALGTMAAGLAHEIRNPLNGAQLHLTVIQRGLTEAHELAEAVTMVSSELARLNDLVSDFLDFARPHALMRAPVVLQTLCHRSTVMLESHAADARVCVAWHGPRTPIHAEVDERRIEQVLLNLLQNGIEAAGRRKDGGNVTLFLSARAGFAVIEVEDDGGGIADEASIWDAFYSTKDAGTGLGLPIVHRIVSDHGGFISVETQPGKTRFRVDLPLEDPERIPQSLVPPSR
jgi:signal transduction histidine kinase